MPARVGQGAILNQLFNTRPINPTAALPGVQIQPGQFAPTRVSSTGVDTMVPGQTQFGAKFQASLAGQPIRGVQGQPARNQLAPGQGNVLGEIIGQQPQQQGVMQAQASPVQRPAELPFLPQMPMEQPVEGPEIQPTPEEAQQQMEEQAVTDDGGGFSFSKFLQAFAPTLIGAAIGGKFGAATGFAATGQFALGQEQREERQEAKAEQDFSQRLNLAIQTGNVDAIRDLEADAPDAFKGLLGGLADSVTAQGEEATFKSTLDLTEKGFTTVALAQAMDLGDANLINDIIGRAETAKVKQLQEAGKNSDTLRKEFSSLSGEFIKVRDAFQRVEAAGKSPSAAGDLALIFNYMKMLDPGSTVREGEFANAQNSGGITDRVRAMYNSLISGQRLSEAQRADFLDRSKSLLTAAQGGQKKLVSEFSRLAERRGVNAEDVIVDFLFRGTEQQEPLTTALDLTGFTDPATGQPLTDIRTR